MALSRQFVSLCCSIALWITLVAAVDIQGRVSWNTVARNAAALGSAKAVLDDGKYAGSVTKSGHFTIPDVPEGTYVLSVITHNYVFDQLRIDVLPALPVTPPTSLSEPEPTDAPSSTRAPSTASQQVDVRPYVPGTPFNPASTILLPYPIKLSAKEKFSYYSPRQSFDVLSMLSNPMMLMMVAAGALAVGMPYLMKNLDPEALKELEGNQAKLAGVQSAFASGNLKDGFSAMMAAADEAVPAGDAPGPKVQKQQKAGTAGKKARR
ncbi:hypothetical protein BKA70DRAFT_1251626 [Coprinopsis sp. MPI-PUGE-AT-0042]|nr:hypothetical protein BKA70DRAFT_1251626 [Coprinopsis sp. MPI-PUGE-AT-0042]